MENLVRTGKLNDYPIADVYPFVDEIKEDVLSSLGYVSDNSTIRLKYSANTMTKRQTYKIKDKKEFVKIYKDSLKTLLKLSQTALRIMFYIMDVIKQNSQFVDIIPKACMDVCGFKTLKSVRDGVIELLEKNILIRSSYMMRYWVNPVVMFNGNRMEFIREYILEE